MESWPHLQVMICDILSYKGSWVKFKDNYEGPAGAAPGMYEHVLWRHAHLLLFPACLSCASLA